MSGYQSGIDGSLSVNGAVVARVSEWQFSFDSGQLATTTLGDVAATYRYGLQSGSGSCDVFCYEDNAGILNAAALTQNAVNGQTCRLKLGVGTRALEFDALITSISMGANAGDVLSASVDFVMTGQLVDSSLVA